MSKPVRISVAAKFLGVTEAAIREKIDSFDLACAGKNGGFVYLSGVVKALGIDPCPTCGSICGECKPAD